MRSEKTSRRTVLKAIGGTAAFAGATGVGNAATRQGTVAELSEPPFDFEYKTVGDDVRDAVGHLWWLLTVDRDRIDELLAKSPVRTEVTRQQETVDALRSAYEVELERDEQNDRELTYHLAEPAGPSLQETKIGQDTLEESKSGKEAVKSVADSVSAGLQREAESGVEPMHSGTIHRKMAGRAVQGTDYENSADDLKDASTDPDQWDQKCRVCSNGWVNLGDRFDLVDISLSAVEDDLRKAIRDIDDSASPHHMYVPGGEEFEVTGLLSIILPPSITLLEVELMGAAPQDAQAHWENATIGSATNIDELGRAFHFLQDMSHPLHTGSIGPQVLDTQGPIHHAYKRFIQDNWNNASDTSKDFADRFDEGANSPQWDGSMEEACKTIANDSTNYSEQVYETIVNNGPNNRDDWDDFVENSAYACMWFAGAYSRGAINNL